jgi:DNA polymerase I-like protein with 3'-5' exonuclease and polymerase domains
VYAKDDYRSIIHRSIIQYSQIELRIVAKISGDKEILSAYAENQDLHTLTAEASPVEKTSVGSVAERAHRVYSRGCAIYTRTLA